jgi:hypothetical protein
LISSQQANPVANPVAKFANSGESSAPSVRLFPAESFYQEETFDLWRNPSLRWRRPIECTILFCEKFQQ